jgi:hypothetical protein
MHNKWSFRSAFSIRKWPGYALWFLGLVQTSIHWGWFTLLDNIGRLDMLWRAAESAGGTPAMLTTAILWPWTGIILIVFGVLYVVFVGEPPSGVQRHPWWPYVGWAIVAFVFVSMVGTAIYGAVALRPVADLEARLAKLEPRRLSVEQRRIITSTLVDSSERLGDISIELISVLTCGDCNQYTADFGETLSGVKWKIKETGGIAITGTSPKGLAILTPDSANPLPEAKALADALTAAKIPFDLNSPGWTPKEFPRVQILISTRSTP